MRNKIIQHHPNYIAYGGHYIKTFMFKDYPTVEAVTILKDIWTDERFLALNIHMRHTKRMAPTKLTWNWSVKWKYRRLYASIKEKEKQVGEVPRIEEVKALNALEDLKNKTGGSRDKYLYDMWNFITISSCCLENLNKAIELLKKKLEAKEILLYNGHYEQAEAFQSSGWIGASGASQDFYENNYARMVDKEALGTFFSFHFGSNSDSKGIYNGHRVEDSTIDLIDVTNGPGGHNFLYIGATGQGKSVILKDNGKNFYYEGHRVFIFDVDGEYRKHCEDVEGLWIDHTLQSGAYTDPSRIAPAIGIPEHDQGRCKEAIDGLIRTISLLAGETAPGEINAIDRAIIKMFTDSDINIDDSRTWDRKHGGIHGWYEYLKKDTTVGGIKLQEKIWRYFEGSMRQMFEREDTDDRISRSDYVVINIGQGIDEDADAHTAMVKLSMGFSAVWNEIKKERARGERWSAVINDELQRSLPNPHFAKFTNKVVSTIRKYNGVWLGGLNNPSVLWPEPTPHNQDQVTAGAAIWENTKYKGFLWMEESGIETLSKKAKIPKQVTEKLSEMLDSNQFIFRRGLREYDLLQKIIPPSEIKRGLYKTRGLRKE
ncbi:MAG: hypothetical protein AB2421_16635 [Thermotaleaceae bacterium]